MLDDALVAFLESVDERAFDEPLLALIRAQGYDDVHLVHGAREFGRDAIGKREDEQWAWQSKAGDIGQGEWRDLVGQLDELRLVNLGHGSFDITVSRRPVLVATGRLKGNAPDLYRDYNERAEEAGQPTLGLWDRDVLLGMLSGNPDAVLRGSVDGQLLATLGSVEERSATMDSLELFSRRWSAWEPERLASLGVIEASLLCDRLAASERVDLACHLAVCFVASSWAAGGGDPKLGEPAAAGAALFKVYAGTLWAEADDRLLREKGLAVYSGTTAWATYPVRCLRIAEVLGLLSLLLADLESELDDPDPSEIAAWLAEFVAAQPGVAHPLGDRYAVSIIPATLALALADPTGAEAYLRATTIWLCDRYERGELGLARPHADPEEEVHRVFGGPLDFVDYERRASSLLASVILDLCTVLEFQDLYADAYNDFQAVRLMPEVLRLSGEGPDAYLALGPGNRLDPHVDYAEGATTAPVAPHHADVAGDLAIEGGRRWDLLAVSSALRDRYFFTALRAFGDEMRPE